MMIVLHTSTFSLQASSCFASYSIVFVVGGVMLFQKMGEETKNERI